MTFTDPDVPVPGGLRTAEFVLRPLTAADAVADWEAVMETAAELRGWEQTGWPADDFTADENRDDLRGLEERHAAHRAFTFTVLDAATGECIGCVYLFPTSARFLAAATVTPVADGAWTEVDGVVYYWVRASRAGDGSDRVLLSALRRWLREDWDFSQPAFVTSAAFDRQRDALAAAGLREAFQLTEPDKPEPYVVYAE